jgi:RES domain-containing protein
VDFAERAARNEDAFREINARIEEGAEQHGVDTPTPFHCECDNARCVEKIEIRPSDYERIVADRYRFVLVPGHEDASVERVVEQTDAYVVAEKIGDARKQIDRDHPQERHRT